MMIPREMISQSDEREICTLPVYVRVLPIPGNLYGRPTSFFYMYFSLCADF